MVLGWLGAAAMVLAALYFIRLAIDAGWLTPTRQVVLATLGAFTLIGIGLWMRETAREYAAYLPAAGVVILFAAVYGAHLYYQIIGSGFAGAAVISICVLALWLGGSFRSDLFGLFAVVGSYSAPFFLPLFRADVTDIAIYYSAWSVLFCAYSVWIGRRTIYLAALYMALLGFDVLQQMTFRDAWVATIVFQFLQLVIFGFTAALYSVRKQSPMNTVEAAAHLPALLIFYVVEYALLQNHVPALAPWVAVGGFAVLAVCYMVARALLKQVPVAGKFLLSSYAALVLLHAVYMELIPFAWGPWVALLLVLLVGVLALAGMEVIVVGAPVLFVLALIFVLNLVRVVADVQLDSVPGGSALPVIYALQIYVAYYFMRQASFSKEAKLGLLYVGHITAMAAAVHTFDSRLAVSTTWGLLAVGCLLLGISGRDRAAAQSSLVLFGATAAKVLLYDLAIASPALRIALLLVLGVVCYFGGWLYRRVSTI